MMIKFLMSIKKLNVELKEVAAADTQQTGGERGDLRVCREW
jgi:hypothetical protein